MSIRAVTALLVHLPVSLLFAQTAPGSGVERNIPYVPGGGHKQQLDLSVPARKGFPTVLFVHGGSLNTGDRTDAPYPQVCESFRTVGVGCAAMSYRLFPAVRWPEPARDVAAAFAWLKRSIASRGGDAARLFLFGHSSGCLLATLVAADQRYLKERGLSSAEVSRVISMGCRLNDALDTTGVPPERVKKYFETDPYESMFGSLEVRNAAVPLRHVGSHMPPVLVLIAETEQYQPPILADATAFAAAARKTGADVEVVVLKDRRHMSAIEKMVSPDDPTPLRILEFVRRTPR